MDNINKKYIDVLVVLCLLLAGVPPLFSPIKSNLLLYAVALYHLLTLLTHL